MKKKIYKDLTAAGTEIRQYIGEAVALSVDKYGILAESKETGRKVAYFPLPALRDAEREEVVVYFLSPEDRLTLPYRKTALANIPYTQHFNDIDNYLMRGYSSIIKPNTPISLNVATTAQGDELIKGFFMYDGEIAERRNEALEELRAAQDGKAGFFQLDKIEADEEEEIEAYEHFASISIPPFMLQELTGRTIATFADYIEAFGMIYGKKPTRKEIKALESPYYFDRIEAYALYCLYTFLYYEDYNRLTEAAQGYKAFGLPDGWQRKEEAKYIIADYGSVEDFAIAQYFHITADYSELDIRSIAETTNTPYRKLIELCGKGRLQRNIDNVAI